MRDGEAAEGRVAVLVVVAGRLVVFHRDAELISQAPGGEATDIGVGEVANVAGEESGLDETVCGLGPGGDIEPGEVLFVLVAGVGQGEDRIEFAFRTAQFGATDQRIIRRAGDGEIFLQGELHGFRVSHRGIVFVLRTGSGGDAAEQKQNEQTERHEDFIRSGARQSDRDARPARRDTTR